MDQYRRALRQAVQTFGSGVVAVVTAAVVAMSTDALDQLGDAAGNFAAIGGTAVASLLAAAAAYAANRNPETLEALSAAWRGVRTAVWTFIGSAVTILVSVFGANATDALGELEEATDVFVAALVGLGATVISGVVGWWTNRTQPAPEPAPEPEPVL